MGMRNVTFNEHRQEPAEDQIWARDVERWGLRSLLRHFHSGTQRRKSPNCLLDKWLSYKLSKQRIIENVKCVGTHIKHPVLHFYRVIRSEWWWVHLLQCCPLSVFFSKWLEHFKSWIFLCLFFSPTIVTILTDIEVHWLVLCISMVCLFYFWQLWLFHRMCKLFNQICGELVAFFAGYWYILVLALKWNIFDPPENNYSILCKCPVGGSNETSRMSFDST